MLIAAAFVPATPLLVPDVASGAARELDALRSAARDAIAFVGRQEATEILLIGDAPRTGPYPVDAVPSFSGFGVGSHPREAGSTLPAALSVGRWLLDSALSESTAPAVPIQAFGVTSLDTPHRCADLGRVLSERSARVVAVVVGDGTNCRGPKAPGSFDERAAAADDQWLEAIANLDVRALAAMDPEQSRELHLNGRAAWQVVAAMVDGPDADGPDADDADETNAEPQWSADLLHHEDPYGVMYAAATWIRSS